MSTEAVVGDGGEGGQYEQRSFDPMDPEVRSKMLSFLGYRAYQEIAEGAEDTITYEQFRRQGHTPIVLTRWVRLPATVWQRG